MRGFAKYMKSCVFIIVFSLLPQFASAKLGRVMQIAPGIYRGSQPETAEDYRDLREMGIKTVVNLRDDWDPTEPKKLAEQGIRHRRFPLGTFSYPDDETVFGALQSMSEPSLQPIYVHCQYGKDRTGLIVGMYRVIHQGWTREEAYKEMRSLGFSWILKNLELFFYLNTPSDDAE
jgi:protein tyrosine/serine phosphatase